MNKSLELASVILRWVMAATFLSAVGARFGFWGHGWQNFLEYTAEVNSFAPKAWVPSLGVAATTLETTFSFLLIVGYLTRLAAAGACGLTLCFALAMAWSFGLKSPMDYSVFVDSAAMLMLAAMPSYKWSVDAWMDRKAPVAAEQLVAV